MTRVGNNVIYHQVLGQNPQYKKKSWTIYINNNHKVCKYYLYKKLVFFMVQCSMCFGLSVFSQLSMHPLFSPLSQMSRVHCIAINTYTQFTQSSPDFVLHTLVT